MADAPALSLLNELPANATYAEALAWATRMRCVVDRWETLPGYADRSMTPELRQQAYNQLADLKRTIERNMQLPVDA
jgi:hypothetical protein